MIDKFLDQQYKTRYRSGDVTAKPIEFYNRVLPCAKLYCRAVGFFSSTSFLEISYGILSLVKNEGKMLLITSPRLNEDDVEAIKKGYESRKDVYLNAFKREISMPKTINEQNRLNILANLIENGILEIKIAVTQNPEVSMYHEKIGLFVDCDGNKIAISGSMNESETAISENFESFQVFCSWKIGEDKRVKTCEDDFYAMWKNEQNSLEVFDFPELPRELIKAYKTMSLSKSDLKQKADLYAEEKSELCVIHDSFEAAKMRNSFFRFPENLFIRPHQQKAIERFVEDDFQCLFAMATGTGKTLTSLFAANELSCRTQLDAILIIVPLKDLVDQWENDIRKYFFETIITVRSGLQWKEKIDDLLLLKVLGKGKSEGRLIIITTYDSFSLNDQKILSAFGENVLIIADEVHKFGAKSYSQKLPKEIKFRIGLSATPKRPYDERGTKAIFDYFCPSEKSYEFGIKEAIDANMLCHYNYYPKIIVMTDDEMDSYELISEKVSRMSAIVNNGNASEEDEERLEQLLKERHRIIERAANKKDEFIILMKEQLKIYKDKTIIFCPDGTDDSGNDLLSLYKSELWNSLKLKGKIVRMSEYVQGTSRKIINDFSAGAIDILFAKQRLNEGIDIPAARRAIFISSSTSEREFIQRRGRVLRKASGKKIAEIFDFIVVPCRASVCSDSIINNEIKRAMNFAVTADNYAEIEQVLRNYL